MVNSMKAWTVAKLALESDASMASGLMTKATRPEARSGLRDESYIPWLGALWVQNCRSHGQGDGLDRGLRGALTVSARSVAQEQGFRP